MDINTIKKAIENIEKEWVTAERLLNLLNKKVSLKNIEILEQMLLEAVKQKYEIITDKEVIKIDNILPVNTLKVKYLFNVDILKYMVN
ncbi:hypothetical protein [Clostridium sp.]|uniref:hypothetical protein n=1 Tax=Clostridium sp. TaxID=1506 RepID=UPI003995C100